MANEELLGAGDAAAAILFQQSYMLSLDVFSAVNSSPWTAESFGGDPDKAASCREYVLHGVGNIVVGSTIAAVVAKRWWPIIGAALGTTYMVWLYERALGRAAASASTGWSG